MSFVVEYSDVILCNRALSLLPEAPIASLDAPGMVARECRQCYRPTVRRVLEMHEWGLPRVRKALALRAVNDRPEWGYCYAQPNDMAFAVSVSEAGQPKYRSANPTAYLFEVIGRSVYTNVQDAALDYTSLSIDEHDFDERLVEAVTHLLAGRLAMPITKRQELAEALERRGLEMVNLAIAQDQWQRNPTYGDGPTESELVRTGAVRLP